MYPESGRGSMAKRQVVGQPVNRGMVCCGRGRGAALVTGAATPTYATIS
jgi:hypothetical protein